MNWTWWVPYVAICIFWLAAAWSRDSAERKLIIADLIAFGESRSRDIITRNGLPSSRVHYHLVVLEHRGKIRRVDDSVPPLYDVKVRGQSDVRQILQECRELPHES